MTNGAIYFRKSQSQILSTATRPNVNGVSPSLQLRCAPFLSRDIVLFDRDRKSSLSTPATNEGVTNPFRSPLMKSLNPGAPSRSCIPPLSNPRSTVSLGLLINNLMWRINVFEAFTSVRVRSHYEAIGALPVIVVRH